MMRWSLLGALAVSAALLSACAGDGLTSGEATPATPSPVPDGATDTVGSATPTSPPPTTTERGTAPNDDTRSCSDVVSGWNTDPESALGYVQAEVVDVRTGRHKCYQRIVFDVDKAVKVGYQIGYVPVLRQEGSGRTLPVAGSATLRVSILASARTIARADGDTLAAGGLPAGPVREIRFAETFEGVSSFGIGLGEKRPFAVSVWQEGSVTHVIVDVAAP